MLYPTQDRRVCQINAAFGHHGHQVTIAQFVAEVPANIQDDDFLVKVPTSEQFFDRYEALVGRSRRRSILDAPEKSDPISIPLGRIERALSLLILEFCRPEKGDVRVCILASDENRLADPLPEPMGSLFMWRQNPIVSIKSLV
jgi:hypothetical protein